MNIIEKTAKFVAAYTKWLAGGGKYRSNEKIDELFEICKSNKCENYIKITEEKGQCNICGCYLKTSKDKTINKLAMSTESCPHNPPLWKADEPTKKPPKKGGCGCNKKN